MDGDKANVLKMRKKQSSLTVCAGAHLEHFWLR